MVEKESAPLKEIFLLLLYN